MAEPAAMGLFGFAVGTFIVAYPIAGFVPIATLTATIPPVLLFAGLAQFIGGLIAFRRNNAFAGTAFCSYGANNVVIATFFLLQTTGAIPATAGTGALKMLALEMYCFAVISLVLAVAAMRLNLMFTLLLLALVPGFTLPGIVNWYGTAADPFIGHLGGYFLIASAVLAAYAAAAMVINSTWKMLPLVPLRPRGDRDAVPRSRTAEPVPVVPARGNTVTRETTVTEQGSAPIRGRATLPHAESGPATDPIDERGHLLDPEYRPDDGGRADG